DNKRSRGARAVTPRNENAAIRGRVFVFVQPLNGDAARRQRVLARRTPSCPRFRATPTGTKTVTCGVEFDSESTLTRWRRVKVDWESTLTRGRRVKVDGRRNSKTVDGHRVG